jgi:glycosyltransferase involved in cell wall biosynthesis
MGKKPGVPITCEEHGDEVAHREELNPLRGIPWDRYYNSRDRMRVGLEATAALERRFTGLPRYSFELARALADLGDEDLSCRILLRVADYRRRRFKLDYAWPVRWYCYGMWPMFPRCDVVHGLGVRVPQAVGRAARVSTFHDMSPVSLPRYGSERSHRNTLRRYAHAVGVADRIIAVSAATKADLLRYYDYPEHRVHVVHHGVSAAFLAVAEHGVKPMGSGRAPYFVAFCGNPRKNLQRTIEAFGRSRLCDTASLHIIGSPSNEEREALRAARLEERARFSVPLDDETMVDVYRGASGLLFPSLIEGFGIPILEAMCCGIPVLTSVLSGTAETAGSHAVLVEPTSLESIGDGIDRLCFIAPQALRDAQTYARTFTWRRTAEQTAAVYRAALS